MDRVERLEKRIETLEKEVRELKLEYCLESNPNLMDVRMMARRRAREGKHVLRDWNRLQDLKEDS